MRDKQFISQGELWEIISNAHYGAVSTEDSFQQLIELMRSAHGKYQIVDDLLVFIPDYYSIVYELKTTTSIIVMDGTGQRSFEDPAARLRNALDTEFEEIAIVVKRFNAIFDRWDRGNELRVFFIERFLKNVTTDNHKIKYRFNNKKYYSYLRASTWIFKKGFMLYQSELTNPLEKQINEFINQ